MSKLLRNSVVIAGTPDTSTEIRHIPGNNRQTTNVGNELVAVQNNLADYYDSTASYVEGDIFNYNGRLVKVILDIDAGDPLVEHTNFEYTNISNLLDMRYNSSTDYIQIKVNGSWVNYKRAYATFDGVIYDNGDTGFEWDNPDPYVVGTGFTWSLGDGETFNVANIGMNFTANYVRGCGISTPIDFTPYMSLKCLANVNGTDVTEALDISTLTGNYYVSLYSAYGHIGGGNNYYYTGFGYSLSKHLVDDGGQSANVNTPGASEPTVYIKKLWLE